MTWSWTDGDRSRVFLYGVSSGLAQWPNFLGVSLGEPGEPGESGPHARLMDWLKLDSCIIIGNEFLFFSFFFSLRVCSL